MDPSRRWSLPALCCIVLMAFSGLSGCLQQESSTQLPGEISAVPTTLSCTTGEVIFLTEELYPFSYVKDDGSPDGYSVAVVRELQDRLHCTNRIEVHPWNLSYDTALRTQGYAVFSTVRTPEREDYFAWVGPIATLEFVLYSESDSGIALQSLEAARNAGIIAVVEGDARHDFLVKNGFTNIRTFTSDEECLGALVNRSVSLFLGSSATTPDTIRKKAIPDGSIVPVYTLLRNDLYIAFNKDTDPGIVHAYQEALDEMKADGTYSRILGIVQAGGASPLVQGGDKMIWVEHFLATLMSLTDMRMHGISSAMQSLSLTSDLKSGNWDHIRPLLISLESSYPEARFWYANPDGSYYTTVDNLTSANLKDRPYFPGVLAGNASIGTIVVSKSTGRYTAIIAVPVVKDGKVSGILGTSVYCDTLEKTLEEEVLFPEGYYFFILDARGEPVLDSLPGQIFSLKNSPKASDFLDSINEGYVNYQYDGSPHKAGFKTSNLTGWKIAVGWKE